MAAEEVDPAKLEIADELIAERNTFDDLAKHQKT